MRLRAILFAVAVLAAAVWAAWEIAGRATAWFEGATAAELDGALDAAGLDWAQIATDGLKVTLSGAAPDETGRFRAHEIVRQIVPEGRITDATTVAAAAPLAPPAFALELLRNEDEISLIGLVPGDGRARRDPLGARRGRARRQGHRHAGGGLRAGAGRVARGAGVRAVGAVRAAAGQGERGAGGGGRHRRRRQRPGARGARGAARAGGAGGRRARPRHLRAAAGDRPLRLRRQPRRRRS